MSETNKPATQFRLSSLLFLTVIVALIATIWNINRTHKAQVDVLRFEIEMLKSQLPSYHLVSMLEATERELLEAKSKLGPKHPKVIALTQEVQLYQKEVDRQREAQKEFLSQ